MSGDPEFKPEFPWKKLEIGVTLSREAWEEHLRDMEKARVKPRMSVAAKIVILVYVVLILLSVLAFWAKPARAHSWYDPECCSTTDCAPAPVGSVLATRNGWVVEIPPFGHPSVGASGWVGTFPYGDTRIKESQDEDFHVCIGVATQAGFCLYVPRGAMGV